MALVLLMGYELTILRGLTFELELQPIGFGSRVFLIRESENRVGPWIPLRSETYLPTFNYSFST